MKLRSFLMLAVGILWVDAARPASAQTPADTAALVRAVGTLLVDSVVPRLGDRSPNYVLEAGTAFDSAVAAILFQTPGISRGTRGRTRGSHQWVGTRGFTLRGDTAAVMVEVGTHTPRKDRGAIDTWIQQTGYLFVREGAGWRMVGRAWVRDIDAGPVRG